MTPEQRFHSAQLAARVPGSQVLDRWLAARGAHERAGVQPSASVRGADSSVVRFGGMEWSDWVRGGLSGIAMNEGIARSISAVVACTNLIGGSLASVPLHFYTRTKEGRERATGGLADSLWWLFNERPHPEWSAASWWQYMSDARLFHGDAFALIGRGGRYGDEPISFEPWHPSLVDVDRIGGTLKYTLRAKDAGGRARTFEADDILHIPGPGFDGRRSMSQLRYGLLYPAGIASAADQQAAQLMADGARPDFAIEIPGQMDQAQREDYRRKWLERHSGQGSKRAPVILTGGMKLHQLTMSMEDAQLLSTRAFQIEEICRIFGVPPHMVGHTDKTTSWGSGIEQQAIGYVTYTLQRHLVAFEQEINHKLFRTARNFCEFLTAGLMRGDTKSRFEAYRIAMGRAGEQSWMRPSEIRKLENMAPDPELDARPANQADAAAAPSQGNQ